MQLYIAVRNDQAPEVERLLGFGSGISHEGLTIFMHMQVTLPAVHILIDSLYENAIAFNGGVYSKTSDFSPEYMWYIRYDHTGEATTPDLSRNVHQIDNIRRMIIHSQLSPKVNTRDIDRIANTLFIRDEWDNQAEYGKIHRMLKLIGGL